MNRAHFTILVAIAMFVFIQGVNGHHAGVMYDTEKEITLVGTIKEFQFTNPHSWLLVNITDDEGTVTTWGFEAEGPTMLMRRGIRKGDFKPGTKITITGHPMKDGRPAAAWTKAILEDDDRVIYSRPPIKE